MNNNSRPNPPFPLSLLGPFTDHEAMWLARDGYITRAALLESAFADNLPTVIDREIAAGRIIPARDRIVNGVPTEWIVSIGSIHGSGSHELPHGEIAIEFQMLFKALQELGRTYNAVLATMLASGRINEEDAAPIAAEGMEMNVNRTVGTNSAQWSGLHLHDDRTRFNRGLQAIPANSVHHDTVKARALTVSGYARPVAADGSRMNDLGGALPLILKETARNPGDKGVLDIVPAHHNTGALFYPGTVHGVARMPIGGVRYSFQAFFPLQSAWTDIERRIHDGELDSPVNA
jgi:hypothetical protein